MSRKQTIISIVKDVFWGVGTKHVWAYAASTAFFFFLSFIPILLIVSSLLPIVGLREDILVEAVTAVTPDMADSFITEMIAEAYQRSAGIFPISLILLIWSAAKGMQALINGFDEIYGIDEKVGWFGVRWRASLYTLAMLVLLVVMLVFMVLTEIVKGYASQYVPDSQILRLMLSNGKYLVLMAVGFGLFTLAYAFVPGENQKVRNQVPGAIFAAVAWGLFSYFFSLFLSGMNSYTTYYGSLTALIFLLFWLYWCSYILLVGAYLNVYLIKRRRYGNDQHLQDR